MGSGTETVRITMRAVGTRRVGSIDSLEPLEIDAPIPAPDELRIKVIASAVNPADVKVVAGRFAGRFVHDRTPPVVVGFDFSGEIERCGERVEGFASGDAVFGFLPYAGATRQGAFSELVTIVPTAIARKPDGVTHEAAAAAATPALTALQALRDSGGLRDGGRAMIVGAAGGVGSVAVGVAKRLGAHVTAVCSTYAIDFVRGLGADEVVDRRKQDPLALAGPFDVVFDVAAAHGYASCRHLLGPSGVYVTTLPSPGFVLGKILAMFSKRRCETLVLASRREDLELVARWIADGLEVPIDSRFPVSELRAALSRLDRGETRGRISIRVADGFAT